MILQRDPGRNRTTCWSNWKHSPTFAPRKTKGKPKRKTRENQGKPGKTKGKPKGKTKRENQENQENQGQSPITRFSEKMEKTGREKQVSHGNSSAQRTTY